MSKLIFWSLNILFNTNTTGKVFIMLLNAELSFSARYNLSSGTVNCSSTFITFAKQIS